MESIISHAQPADSPGTPPLPPANWPVIDAWLAEHGMPPWPAGGAR